MKKESLYLLFIIFTFYLLFNGCKKIVVPSLTTENITSITQTSACSGGLITSDGGASIIANGVCWSTLNNPTINDSKTADSVGVDSFLSNISGLVANTIYYIRAYATNNAGTGYGNELIVKTYTGTVKDLDGNIYNTVTIGNQIWMAENLKTTKYNDGSDIQNITDLAEWLNLKSGAYCWYNNNEFYIETYHVENVYGALYNWYSLNPDKLCPTGWHVPSHSDLMSLQSFLGDYGEAGSKLKESGIIHWASPNLGATNETSFNALPGGCRSIGSRDVYKNFSNLFLSGYWWSSTESNANTAIFLGLYHKYASFEVHDIDKFVGLSIRCLKDSI